MFRLYTSIFDDRDDITFMDEDYKAIVSKCKKLTRLSMTDLVTSEDLNYIVEHGKFARTLSLSFMSQSLGSMMSEETFIPVFKGFPKPQMLEVLSYLFGDKSFLSGLPRYRNVRCLLLDNT